MATDKEIFDQAIAPEQNENVPDEAIEAPTEENVGRTRDDRGRFASRAPEPPQEVVQEQPLQSEQEEARVPSWRLKEESERRREAEQRHQDLERQLRDMQIALRTQNRPQPQQQQEPIDPFADPQGFARGIYTQLEQARAMDRLENSIRFASYKHGEVLDSAYQAFIDYNHRSQDPATYQRVMASGDPGEALVRWYKDQELQKELGGSDLKSFLDKQREEWLKDPKVQAQVIEAFKASQGQGPSANTTNIPPSLSRVASAAPVDAGSNDASQAAVFKYAMGK